MIAFLRSLFAGPDWAHVSRRAVATAGQSFFAIWAGSSIDLVDASLWQAAATAALGGVVTVLHRTFTDWRDTLGVDLSGPLTQGPPADG